MQVASPDWLTPSLTQLTLDCDIELTYDSCMDLIGEDSKADIEVPSCSVMDIEACYLGCIRDNGYLA